MDKQIYFEKASYIGVQFSSSEVPFKVQFGFPVDLPFKYYKGQFTQFLQKGKKEHLASLALGTSKMEKKRKMHFNFSGRSPESWKRD